MPGVGSLETTGAAASETAGRRIVPVRRLVSGRALVGALLVASAAVVAFAVHLDATRGPQEAYVVARAPVAAGTRLDDLERVRELFGVAMLDLGASVGGRAVAGRDVDALVGQVVLAPLEAGDLLHQTALGDRRGPGAEGYALSFALPRSAAVGGDLRPGEHVDVLATSGAGAGTPTTEIVGRVTLLAVVQDDRGLVGSSALTELTVALESSAEVRALAHAVSTADLLVVRSPSAAASASPGGARGGERRE